MMKRWLVIIGLILVTVVFVSGCGNKEAGTDVQNTTGETKEFTIEGSNFEFDQKEIKVNQGDTVKMTLKSTEGVHAIKIDGYGDEIKEGKTITFVANKKGEFKFICSLACGVGHGDMVGKLVVE